MIELFDLPLQKQHEFIAEALNLGPGWNQEPSKWLWAYLFNTLLSVRRYDGKAAFYREIGRINVEGGNEL